MEKAIIPQSCKDERCPLSPWLSVNNNVCLRHASRVRVAQNKFSEPFVFKLILVLLQCHLLRTNSDMLLINIVVVITLWQRNYKKIIKYS